MKMATFAGSHACGKTSVIMKTIEILSEQSTHVGVVKSDCLYSDEASFFSAAGIPHRKLLSGNVCPDHHFADNVLRIFEWGKEEKLDLLLCESAGLCGRCAPHIRGVPAVCVLDCMSGISAPKKAGPMLLYADHIVITKSDLVSPTEREVFLYNAQQINPRAGISFVNGLTGQGAWKLSTFLLNQGELQSLEGKQLRFTMPSAQCNFCAGQTVLSVNSGGGRIKDDFGKEPCL